MPWQWLQWANPSLIFAQIGFVQCAQRRSANFFFLKSKKKKKKKEKMMMMKKKQQALIR